MAGYGSDDGYATWLADNGYPAHSGALTVAQLRQRGSDYVDGLYEGRFPGYRTGGIDQERAWPRTGARVHCQAVDPAVIPAAVVKASYVAALYEQANPGGLAVAVTAAGAVKREKIDVIETEYFAGSGDVALDATVRLSAVDGLLASLLFEDIGTRLGLWAVG
jgi:hypothetical protein